MIWAEKYRPRRIEDTILSADLQKSFSVYVEKGTLPNMLFHGPAGCGKTTVAKALCDQLGFDWMLINGSLRGNIDTLRTDIMQFASTVSLTGARKVIIIDEADYLNAQSTQPAMRGFLDEFSRNCTFILTCNYPQRLIEPLRSRFEQYDFKVAKEDRVAFVKKTFARCAHVLNAEGVEYNDDVLRRLVVKHFPDVRQLLLTLQKCASRGPIDAGALSAADNTDVAEVFKYVQERDFNSMRKWVAENSQSESSSFFRELYDYAITALPASSLPQLVVILAKYQYQAAFVADQEVNLVACLTEVMADCEFQ